MKVLDEGPGDTWRSWDGRSERKPEEDKRTATMTEVEFARKREAVDVVATGDENPQEADKGTTDEEVRQVDPTPHQLGMMDDRERALLLEKDMAQSARKSKAGEYARMIAALETAPEVSKIAIAEGQAERYIPAELLQVTLTARKYVENGRKVAKILNEWRSAVLGGVAEWGIAHLRQMGLNKAYVAKSYFYNKYVLATRVILQIAGCASRKSLLRRDGQVIARPTSWAAMDGTGRTREKPRCKTSQHKESHKRTRHCTSQGRPRSVDREGEGHLPNWTKSSADPQRWNRMLQQGTDGATEWRAAVRTRKTNVRLY